MRSYILLGLLAARTLSLGQTLAFEAASVKPSSADSNQADVQSRSGRLTMRNVTLKRCIRGAYYIPELSVVGGPKWIDDARFDIEAKAPGPAGDHDLMLMLQTLLADRFHLVCHRETRSMPGYELVLAKGGLKAKPSAPDAAGRTSRSRIEIDAQGSTMGNLAEKLADALGVPVSDFTGVSGRFDFQLRWTPEQVAGKSDAAPDTGPSIFAALQEQLGLKLESRKVPVEVVVIDSAEKATEN